MTNPKPTSAKSQYSRSKTRSPPGWIRPADKNIVIRMDPFSSVLGGEKFRNFFKKIKNSLVIFLPSYSPWGEPMVAVE